MKSPRVLNPDRVEREGMCGSCRTWVPRDDMRSMNVNVFPPGFGKKPVTIRLRLCERCLASLTADMKAMEWCRSEHERDQDAA